MAARYLGKKILTLCVLLTLFSCDKEEVSSKESLSPIGEVALPPEMPLGQSITFLIKHGVYNQCGQYSRNETNQQGNELEITFYAKYASKSGACTQAIETRETEYKFTPKNSGTYIFKFRQVNGYLTDTLMVK